MPDLLYIQSSPRGVESESNALAAAFLAAYTAGAPDADVEVLDLWAEELPVFAGDHVAAKMQVIAGVGHEGAVKTAWDEIVALTERFKAADQYLFTVPMWNHGVPWPLKQLIDTITQPGLTFGLDDGGYVGLVDGKRAAVLHTSAIWPTHGENEQPDHVESWLRMIGVDDIASVWLGSNLLDPNVAAERERARSAAAELGRRFASAAAARRPGRPALRAAR